MRTRGEGVKILRLCLVFTTYGLIGGEVDKRRQEWRLTRGELKFPRLVFTAYGLMHVQISSVYIPISLPT